MTYPFRRPGMKNRFLYSVKVLPSRIPWSSKYTCAHRSSRLRGRGVPVKPHRCFINGRTFRSALNRWALGLRKLDSSSTITMSKGQPSPYAFTSHGTFSRLMQYTSAFLASAARRSRALPNTRLTRRCFRWSHFSLSRLQVSSATRKGAITRTLDTSKLSYRSRSAAVNAIDVFPMPGFRNRPAAE